MSYVDDMMEFNKKFVDEKKYKPYKTTKIPSKKIAIVSCMDTRLTDLLPAALNFKNGDIKIIKNAGAIISHPFGSVMRSIIIAIYKLGVEEIFVIGHYDCGMQDLNSSDIIRKMLDRKISNESIDMVRYCGVDIDKWLKGFSCVEQSINETVDIIKNHPLIPEDIKVFGFIIDPETGKLEKLV